MSLEKSQTSYAYIGQGTAAVSLENTQIYIYSIIDIHQIICIHGTRDCRSVAGEHKYFVIDIRTYYTGLP